MSSMARMRLSNCHRASITGSQGGSNRSGGACGMAVPLKLSPGWIVPAEHSRSTCVGGQGRGDQSPQARYRLASITEQQLRLAPQLWTSIPGWRAHFDRVRRVGRQSDHRQAHVQVPTDALVSAQRTSAITGENLCPRWPSAPRHREMVSRLPSQRTQPFGLLHDPTKSNALNPFSLLAIRCLTVRLTRSRTPIHVDACKPHVR
jgi:hypothetical protein